jgi:RND family efflux transporter MFP subunit
MMDMANGLSRFNLKSVGVLWDLGTFTGLDDRELIARFVDRRDGSAEIAFESLVCRHGPMVLGVCRGLLQDRHAAEDAFQAVFIVLARKARSIQRPEQLGPWLYGVALKTARESRKREERRRRLELRGQEMSSSGPIPPDQALLLVEEAEALHSEIARLPERYRAAVVLCDLEGLTHQEAASRLQCPVGTIAIRLKRARERLRDRLTRRGLAPSSGLILTLSRTEIPRGLIDSTVKAALANGFATASVISLAEGVRMTMLGSKWKAATTLTILALGLTATWAASGGFAGPEPDDPPPGASSRTTGHAAPTREEKIIAKVSGYLEKTLVEEGARVKANDVLFEIEPRPFVVELSWAEAAVKKAEAQKKLATAVKQRNLALLKKSPDYIAPEDMAKAEAELTSSVEVLKSASQMALAAKQALEETRIKAPFDGVLIRRIARPGDRIKADETVLAILVTTDPGAKSTDAEERSIARAVTREVRDYQDFAGHVEVFRGTIQPGTVGIISKVHFPDGGPVKEKDLLFEIDSSRPIAGIQASIESLKKTLPELKAKAEPASEALKKIEARRASHPQFSVKEEEEYDWAVLKNQEASKPVSIAEAQIEMMSAQLHEIPPLTKIRATFEGNLARPLVKVGDTIKSTQTTLATYEATDRLSVAFDVEEQTLKKLNTDDWFKDQIVLSDSNALVILAGESSFPLRAQVEHSPKVIDPATKAYRWKATIRDRDRIIRPGMDAKVRLNIDRFHEALLIPDSAIMTDDNQNRVYVLNDRDIVEARPVQVGLLHAGFREIREGLKAGERVVIEDLASLKPGMTIKPRIAAKSGR